MSEEFICAITPPNSPRSSAPHGKCLEIHSHNQGCDDSNSPHKPIPAFRWFSCLGEAKLEKIHLSEDGYIKNNELHIFEDLGMCSSNTIEQTNITLFNEIFDFGFVFFYKREVLFRMAKNEILFLQDAAKSSHRDIHIFSEFHLSPDYLEGRRNCVKMFLYIREYLNWTVFPKYSWILTNFISKMKENLNEFRLFLGRITDLPEYILQHAAHSQGNKCQEASYHLFHCYLDMLWLHITAVYQLDMCCRQMGDCTFASQQPESNVTFSQVTLEQSVLALVTDLIQLAIVQFEKVGLRSLLIKSPFNCSCVAELWIMIQALTNKLHTNGFLDNFWAFVNKVLKNLLESNGQISYKGSCITIPHSITYACSNLHAFSMWFLKHTAMLYTFNDKCNCSNYPLLESLVKDLLASDISEAQLRTYLIFLEKILTKYWEPKSDVIILLWEHFQKRLNSTFYIPGSSLDSVLIMSESVLGMVNQVKSRLTNNHHCVDSFQMFLRLLGLHLQRVSGQSQHWNQIRGRIYSKLSTSKIQALTETGLYHLSSLFLTLALTADLNDVSKKLQVLLGSLRESELEPGMCQLLWRTHLSLCLLFAERGQDFTAIISPLTTLLEDIGSNQDIFTLARTFLDGVKDILECSHTLKINHNILIGSWISKYLAKCSSSDAVRLLETLQTLIRRVQKQPLEQQMFQSCLWQFICPYIKLKISEEGPLQLADIGLNLCLLSYTYSDTLKEILQLFLNNNSVNTGVLKRFLCQLVQQKDLLELLKRSSPSSQESIEVLVIKGWIHCSLLSLEYKSSELSRITNYITHLPFIMDICMDLPTSTDPLKHFIVAVSNKFKSAKDIYAKSSLRQRMSRYLMGMEKWVEPYIKEPKSPEIICRIYHVVGLIFSLMPSFIYVKSRPSTVLKGILDLMFLPLGAYKADYEPTPHIKKALLTDIHLYIRGLAELAMMQDAYINRCIEDLIKIYLPWVVISNCCVLHECIERADCSARLILLTVCSTFIKRKAPSPHPQCLQALKFLVLIAKAYSREISVMLLLTDCCFESVSDVIMFCDDFHPCKKTARDVLVLLFESHSFGDELSGKIIEKFENLSRDYLPFLPGRLFILFHEVLQYRPELVSRFLPSLIKHIQDVESRRGINYDQSLRIYFEKLDKALKCLRNGRQYMDER